MIGIAPAWLAFMFSWHIALVNLGIGLSWIVPLLKWRADKTGDTQLEGVARTLMRFYAASYGLAGVFGTAFTVFLLSYYPDFLQVAGHIALVPFAISILALALHFFAIAAYYYGWDRWSRTTHYAIGAALAVTALLIPLGFRAVFAFLNIPAGLVVDATSGVVHYGLALGPALFSNPTTIPLYIKSIAAAFTVTFLAVAGGYAFKYLRAESEEERKTALRVIRMMAKPATVGVALMVILGLWYAVSLESVPYKFNNVFASLGWSVGPDKTAYYNVAWLFVLKMIFFAVQIAAVVYALPKLLRGETSGAALKLLAVAGVAAVLTVPLGELLNAFSQYPFFIAVWPDVLAGHVAPATLVQKYGVVIKPLNKQVLSTVIDTINSVVLVDGGKGSSAYHVLQKLAAKYPAFKSLEALSATAVNEIAVEPAVVGLTYAFIVGLLIGASYLLYIILFPPKKSAKATV